MLHKAKDRPLKVCILSYRIDPFCGGQGVYVQNLSKALKELGHSVEVISGPPTVSFKNLSVHKLSSLDLYNPINLFKTPRLKVLLNPINFLEWFGVSIMGFPEPLVFGLRCSNFLTKRYDKYDIVHDNQSLSYGIWFISKKIPTVATIHHPILRDRNISLRNADSLWERFKIYRWYGFYKMQKRISKVISRIITVSKSSKKDIVNDFGVLNRKIKVIYNGVNTRIFKPLSGVKVSEKIIITTCSSGDPIKGLKYLLRAIAYINSIYKIKLVIVGEDKFKIDISKIVKEFDLLNLIEFTGKISETNLVYQYSRANVAVIPSVYEGFGLPVVEAMACGVPVVGTTGGALPEVIGTAGILVIPKDYLALSYAIIRVLGDFKLAHSMRRVGLARVRNNFSWLKTAEETVKVYREVIN